MAHLSCRRPSVAASLAAVTVLGIFSTVAHAATTVATATPAASCTSSPYAYAGLESNVAASGIQAVVTTLAVPDVPTGHVAGWIGIGGPNAGPGGEAEWIQTGVDTQAGAGSDLYAEINQPGQPIRYVALASGVTPGSSYRLAVVQLPGQPDEWQVLVNGVVSVDPVYLPGSGSFQPMAMSESWDGGTPACNGYAYRFNRVQITTNGSWHDLTNAYVQTDQGYLVTDRTKAGFTALSA